MLRLEKLTITILLFPCSLPHLFSSQVDFVDLTSPKKAHRQGLRGGSSFQGTRTPKFTPHRCTRPLMLVLEITRVLTQHNPPKISHVNLSIPSINHSRISPSSPSSLLFLPQSFFGQRVPPNKFPLDQCNFHDYGRMGSDLLLVEISSARD